MCVYTFIYILKCVYTFIYLYVCLFESRGHWKREGENLRQALHPALRSEPVGKSRVHGLTTEPPKQSLMQRFSIFKKLQIQYLAQMCGRPVDLLIHRLFAT